MSKDIIDKTLLSQAQEQLEIKRVRVSERLIHDYQNYLFQEFGNKYSQLITAYNSQFVSKSDMVTSDPQEILRMSASEMMLYQNVVVKHDRNAVRDLYLAQFRSASTASLVKFMALYDATQSSEATLVSNQLTNLTNEIKALNTTLKQMRVGTDIMAEGVASVVKASAWLSAAQLGSIPSYDVESYPNTLYDDSVVNLENALNAYGKEKFKQDVDSQKRNLYGGH